MTIPRMFTLSAFVALVAGAVFAHEADMFTKPAVAIAPNKAFGAGSSRALGAVFSIVETLNPRFNIVTP